MSKKRQAQIQTQLQNGLSQFGLDPLDWSLIAISSTLFQIVNQQDGHFQFIGRCNGRGQWLRVELLSL